MARVRYKIEELEREYGDLNKIIPKLTNEGGQNFAAFQLNTSTFTISNWLKEHGYVKQVTWVQKSNLEKVS